MPATLTNTISKIQLVPNSTNASLITEFHKYMLSNGASQRHQNNSLKRVIAFANYLGNNCTFYDLHRPDQIPTSQIPKSHNFSTQEGADA